MIQADPRLKKLFDLMVSVTGVGYLIATELLIATNEMQTTNEPKKLAASAIRLSCECYPPFEYRSGSSVRGKTKVSHQARKRLKALIHLGAMSAIQIVEDFQDYYIRKLKEGKPKMLVINAVRNKMIHRVCAMIRRGEKNDKIIRQPLLNR